MKEELSDSVTQLAIENNKREQEMRALQLKTQKQLEEQHQLVLTTQQELLRERATIAHLAEQVRTIHTTNYGISEINTTS